MDDGRVRTIEQAQAPRTGERVTRGGQDAEARTGRRAGLSGLRVEPEPARYCTASTRRYWIASARCASAMASLPARSAMLRAMRSTRW